MKPTRINGTMVCLVIGIAGALGSPTAQAANFFAPAVYCDYPSQCETTWEIMSYSLDAAVDFLADNFGQGKNVKDGDWIYAKVRQTGHPNAPGGCYRIFEWKHEVDVTGSIATLINPTQTMNAVTGCGT